MYISRILYPVEVLGPGKRIGIWFCGCPRRCDGCSNPELWEFQNRYKTTSETVMSLINKVSAKNKIDGFTITGGDPFFQINDLIELIKNIKSISDDIIVYTGYLKDDLPSQSLKDIAVLIDGEYIKERNNNCILRGSDNQRIYIFNNKYQEIYEKYLSTAKNQIQNFTTQDGYISVDLHHPDLSF